MFGLGLYTYYQGLDGFSKLVTDYQMKREALENDIRSKKDVEHCLDAIKNYRPSDEVLFFQRQSNPTYNPINIDNLLGRVKERKAMCIKGSYGNEKKKNFVVF